MARMLATIQFHKLGQRCCKNCVFSDGRFRHLGKDPRFRKRARAADKNSWKKEAP